MERRPDTAGLSFLDGPAFFGCKLLGSRLLGLPNLESKREKTDREVGYWEEKLDSPTPSPP